MVHQSNAENAQVFRKLHFQVQTQMENMEMVFMLLALRGFNRWSRDHAQVTLDHFCKERRERQLPLV